MLNTLYSYLIRYTADYQPIPDIAERWTIAEDRRSMTIELRETTFHDGSPLTADDIVTGVKRAKDPGTGLSQTSSTSFIESATAAGARTVKLTFGDAVNEDRIFDFMAWFPVVQGKANQPDSLKKTPAGCGPYALESYQPGNELVLRRFEHYWEPDRPYLDTVTFRFLGSKDSAVVALEAGDVDGALALDGRHYARLKDRFDIVTGAPGALIVQFSMNVNLPPFDNKYVRQALARAINRDRMVEQVQFGVGQAVYSIFPPGSPAFDKTYLDSAGFDLQAAKAPLDKASGVSLKASCVINQIAEYNARNLEIMQEDLASIGFELTIDAKDAAGAAETYQSGKAQCYMGASSNSFRGATGMTSNTAFRLANNPMLKDNVPAAYRAAVAKADAAIEPAAVTTATKELTEVIMDECFAVGVYTLEQPSAISREFHGYDRMVADHPLLTQTYRTA